MILRFVKHDRNEMHRCSKLPQHVQNSFDPQGDYYFHTDEYNGGVCLSSIDSQWSCRGAGAQCQARSVWIAVAIEIKKQMLRV